jgi:hypothetical protein
MKDLIYRNEAFENETRAGMQVTLEAYKKLLSIWDEQKLGECQDLFNLAAQPKQVFRAAFQNSLKVPAEISGLKINRSAFLNMVEEPEPTELYKQAGITSKSPAFGYRDVFSIKDGSVFMDPERAEEVIMSQNIYALNAEQKELGEAVIEYVRLSNYIDKRFTEIEWQYIPAPPFSMVGRHFPLVSMLNLEVEQLRLILSKV